MELHEQFLLRVRKGSEVDRLLTALTQGYLSDDEANDVGGFSRSHMVARSWLPKWFDNIALNEQRGSSKYQLSYIPTRSTVVQSIKNAEFVVDGGASGGRADDNAVAGEIVWPDAPPLIERMEEFRKPTFYKMMNAMTNLGRHTSLAGPPGIGKSTCVEQLAAETGIPLVNVSADAGLRRRDLVGHTEMINGTTKFTVAEYAAAVVNGWWVKIDEINAADPDVVLFINSQLAAPHVINIHGKMYPVHPRFRLFVTYNPGLVGTKPLPPAFKDRFYPVKLVFPTDTGLIRILAAHGLPTDADWATTLIMFARNMWTAHERGQMRYQISPRRLIDAILLMNENIVTDVKQALKMAVIACIDSPLESKTAEQILGGL